jgi:hypothetical protein
MAEINIKQKTGMKRKYILNKQAWMLKNFSRKAILYRLREEGLALQSRKKTSKGW